MIGPKPTGKITAKREKDHCEINFYTYLMQIRVYWDRIHIFFVYLCQYSATYIGICIIIEVLVSMSPSRQTR